jgi:transcriptional regulator with XRE-family HTH domain
VKLTDAELRFVERIRMVRKAHNWSITEVARRSGVARVAVSRIENLDRGISLGEALDLARAVGVDLDDLVREGTFSAYATIAIEVDAW